MPRRPSRPLKAGVDGAGECRWQAEKVARAGAGQGGRGGLRWKRPWLDRGWRGRTRGRVDASEAFAGIPDRSQQRRPVGSVGRARRRSPRPRRLSTFDSLADGGLIHRHGLSNESFECLLIDLLALMHIDRTAQVAFEDGVEQA